jgi:uncharacterized protein YggE
MVNRLNIAVLLALSLSPPILSAQPQGEAQEQSARAHVITVTRGGSAFAKPDVGVLAMTLRSTAPIAGEAVAQNGRKAKEVEKALAKLGYAPQAYKLTPVIFAEAGGPRYGPGQPGITVYEASQYAYVFFEGADLADMPRLTEKSAAVIEALRKAGAVPATVASPRFPQAPGGMIIYTIKDSAPYERQALQQALARARDAAQDIAKGMQVQITGLRNVKSGFLRGNQMPSSGMPYLQGLPYRFYSTKSDEVEVSASATVDFDFK